MGDYLDGLWDDLERVWELAMKVNDLSEKERADTRAAWNGVFKPSGMVDVARTEAQAEDPPRRIFCKNIYGLQFNGETRYWIPFRHGDIDMARFMED